MHQRPQIAHVIYVVGLDGHIVHPVRPRVTRQAAHPHVPIGSADELAIDKIVGVHPIPCVPEVTHAPAEFTLEL
jgi:hypothetical protein